MLVGEVAAARHSHQFQAWHGIPAAQHWRQRASKVVVCKEVEKSATGKRRH